MVSLTLPNKLALEFSNAQVPRMKDFASMLNGIGVQHFHYIKVYYDGHYIHLNSDESLNTFYCENITKPSPVLKAFLQSPHTDTIWPTQNLDVLFLWLLDHNFAHGYTVRNFCPAYYEAFTFSTTKDNFNIINQYICMRTELYRFIKYFKYKAVDILSAAESCPAYYEEFDVDLSKIKNKTKPCTLDIPWISDKGEFSPSEQQIRCLELLSKGLSIKEIANKLDLSPRTVEYHLNKLKDKLDIRFKTQLVNLYNQNMDCNL